jgi:hypothetical protein
MIRAWAMFGLAIAVFMGSMVLFYHIGFIH